MLWDKQILLFFSNIIIICKQAILNSSVNNALRIEHRCVGAVYLVYGYFSLHKNMLIA